MLFIGNDSPRELIVSKRAELSRLRRSESRRGWLLAGMIPGLIIGAATLGAATETMPGRPFVLGAYILLMLPAAYFGVSFHAKAEERRLEANRELRSLEAMEPLEP